MKEQGSYCTTDFFLLKTMACINYDTLPYIQSRSNNKMSSRASQTLICMYV